MATANLGITLPTVGGSTDTWGTTLNTGITAIDALFSVSGTDVTMSDIKFNSMSVQETGAGTDTVKIQAPSAVSSSYTLTMPAAVGSANQVLSAADGSGTLAWTTPETGDITSVVAGAGMTGGGTSGAVTLNVIGTADKITVSADAVTIASGYVGQSSITTLGTIGTGVWNGTAIANANLANSTVAYGGVTLALGASDATPAFNLSDATAYTGDSALVTTGTITSGTWQGTTVAVNQGGTGLASYTAGDVIYASGTTTLAKLAKGSDTEVLTLASGVPTWAAPTVGDITGVTAGTGLSGGGTSGTVTLNVEASQTQVTALGTIATGVWNGTKVASAYLDDDTAHLSGTQTFSGAKTFSSTLAVSGSSGAGVGTIRLVANVFKFQAGTSGFTVANSGNSADILTISDAGAVAAGGTLAVTGNVGMGTGSGVGHALEVVEDAADTNMARFKYTATAAPSASKGLNLWNTATGSTTDGGLVFSMSDNGGIERYAGSITVDKVGTWTDVASTRDGQMRFNTAVDGVIAERFRIKQTGVVNFTSNVEMAGDLAVTGAVSKGSGSFKIAHPLPAKADTHHLVHSFIEGPQADLIYRGVAALSGGSATVDLDEAAGMTEGTWELLCRDPQVWIQNDSGWGAVRGSVEGNTLTIACEDAASTDSVSWMVVAERCDPHMMDTGWTDENGRVIVEPLVDVGV